MDPSTAYRAIIQLLAGDRNAYEAILDENTSMVRAKYHRKDKKPLGGNIDTRKGIMYLDDGNIIEFRHKGV